MERWQRNHLARYRVRLVEKVMCNELIFSYLISQKVLANVDVERIKRSADRYEQAAVLLDIVETRQNGFVAMARALSRVNQTGPCSVFMEGFARHVIPDVTVDFLGKTLHLTALFDSSRMERILHGIKAHLTLEEYVSLYDKSQNAKPIKLLSDTIPETNSFYVPRSLSKRVKVNPEVFKMKCSDVFVFKQIDFSKLTKLVEPQRVGFSSNQLLSLSARFIILEHAEDWEEICNITGATVHLIKHEEEKGKGYVLEATTGGSTVIHQFLIHQQAPENQDDNVSISEEDFLEEVSRDGASGVCICDLPGMGKSLLLANLARKMKEKHAEKIVVFIQLSQFLAFVTDKKGKQVTSSTDLTFASKMLLEYIASSQLEYFLLTEILKSCSTQLELFLDGFDEVQIGQLSIGKQLLTQLVNQPFTRIFVTSRPNMRHELEASLRVISYDILPFSIENQYAFLTDFWSSLKPTNSKEKLQEFARVCVRELKRNVNENEKAITGIPLQCRLVAEVFSRAANVFAQPGRSVTTEALCNVEGSLPELYRRCLELSFNKFAIRVTGAYPSKSGLLHAAEQATRLMEAVIGEEACLSKLQKIKDFHMLSAVNLILPESSEIFSQVFGAAVTTFQNVDMLSVGLLQRQFSEGCETLQFVHRTFAEYLVAEFFAKILYSKMGNKKLRTLLVQLLFNEVMKIYREYDRLVFVRPVVIHFLNAACAQKIINSNDKVLFSTFASCVSANHLYRVIFFLIRDNHVNLLDVLNQVMSKMTLQQLSSYKRELNVMNLTGLVCSAVESGNVFLVEKLFQLFHECLSIDLDNRYHQMTTTAVGNDNPLRLAMVKLDYEMVQFFADRIPFKGGGFIREWIGASISNTAAQREKILRILTCLLDKNKYLLRELSTDLLNTRPVHLDIIKLLFRRGVDPRSTYFGSTIVHKAAEYMTTENFTELCRVLVDEFGAADLFEEVKLKWISPLPAMLANGHISESIIQKIYDFPCLPVNSIATTRPKNGRIRVDMNYSTFFDRTLLMNASIGKRSIELITSMIEMGANAFAQDKEGNTFAHFIPWGCSPKKYHQFVEMMIHKDMGEIFKVTNNKKRTPLFEAVKHGKLHPKTLALLVGRAKTLITEQKKYRNSYVDLNAVDVDGHPILYYAVREKRSLELVKYLIELGAVWSITNLDKPYFSK